MELEFDKATDTEHKIKLESSLMFAAWRSGLARAGQPAGFEVETSFVGNGSKIKVKGRSENGENLGKVSGKIRNNKFVGELSIPEDIELDDRVYFEVKLPQNGLSGESNRIPVALPVQVTNMKWSAKEARRGDILTLSANVSGCREGTEAAVTIYEYDRDGIHDNVVELPATVTDDRIELDWEFDYQGDIDEIPTEDELKKYGKHYSPPEYFFVVEINGQKFGRKQESGLLTFKERIEIRLSDDKEQEKQNLDYVLHLPDGTERKGKLDEGGYASEDDLPPGRIELKFPEGGAGTVEYG
jgi:hypothetical protein